MTQDPLKTLEIKQNKLVSLVTQAIRTNSMRIYSRLVSKHLRGQTTPTTVRRRSGSLSRSVGALIPHIEGSKITGGIRVGTRYAGVHIGPRGSTVTITPKKAKYLAIPLQVAQTAAGVARGGPRSGIWGKTFIAKSKAGNLIIFGRSDGTKKGTGTSPIPLFVLKSKVVIPRRVDPDVDLLKWVKPQFEKDLLKAIVKAG